jgi:hypothetical protein
MSACLLPLQNTTLSITQDPLAHTTSCGGIRQQRGGYLDAGTRDEYGRLKDTISGSHNTVGGVLLHDESKACGD